MPVSAKLDVSLSVSQSGSNAFAGGPFWNAAMTLSQAFSDGTTANKFDRVYVAERTVLTGANDDIDLSGVLTDAFGSTITAVELVGILLINQAKDGSVNTTNLTVGGSTSGVPGFTTAGSVVKPGGVYLVMNPDATGIATITASTGDILRITNSAGASNKYQIAVLLRSA